MNQKKAIVVERLATEDFKNRIQKLREEASEFQILDIRTAEEYAEGFLENARQLDFYAPDFACKLNELPREQLYLIYCRKGNRTGITLELMRQLGFLSIADLKDGISDWIAKGYPLTK